MGKKWTGGLMNNINVELFGNDPKIQKAISVARNVSVTKASVLITAEIGVGKKSLARFIHNNSKPIITSQIIIVISKLSK